MPTRKTQKSQLALDALGLSVLGVIILNEISSLTKILNPSTEKDKKKSDSSGMLFDAIMVGFITGLNYQDKTPVEQATLSNIIDKAAQDPTLSQIAFAQIANIKRDINTAYQMQYNKLSELGKKELTESMLLTPQNWHGSSHTDKLLFATNRLIQKLGKDSPGYYSRGLDLYYHCKAYGIGTQAALAHNLFEISKEIGKTAKVLLDKQTDPAYWVKTFLDLHCSLLYIRGTGEKAYKAASFVTTAPIAFAIESFSTILIAFITGLINQAALIDDLENTPSSCDSISETFTKSFKDHKKRLKDLNKELAGEKDIILIDSDNSIENLKPNQIGIELNDGELYICHRDKEKLVKFKIENSDEQKDLSQSLYNRILQRLDPSTRTTLDLTLQNKKEISSCINKKIETPEITTILFSKPNETIKELEAKKYLGKDSIISDIVDQAKALTKATQATTVISSFKLGELCASMYYGSPKHSRQKSARTK